MRYTSKIGPELVVPLSLILATVAGIMIIAKLWIGLILVMAASLFCIHMFLTTFYRVVGHTLEISCGFLFNITIDIHDIKTIGETRNPISSPAASIDRLDIGYGKKDHVLISPKDKQGFIKELLGINPAIVVKNISK